MARSSISRRRFLGAFSAAGAMLRGRLRAQSGGVDPRGNPVGGILGGGAQRLVTKADLKWIGTFQGPNINAGAMKFPMMTVRRSAGMLRTLWIASNGFFLDETSDLCECTYPGASPTPGAIVSTLIHNYGHGYLSKLWANGQNPPDHISRASIFWDAEQNCVVLNYSQDYSGQNDPSFVLGFIDDTAHTCTWAGPFRSAAGSKQTQGFGCLIPASYANRYLGGKRYALGKNGGAIDAAEAFAPVLHATARPSAATAPSADASKVSKPNPAGENGPDLAYVTLLGGDINHRGKRPGDYFDVACGGTGVGAVDPTSLSRTRLTGRINTSSGVGSVVWLDWTNLKGVVFLGSLSRGHCWYNTAGNGFVILSGQSGTFTNAENMTGRTSGVVKQAKSTATYGAEVPARWLGPHVEWSDAGAANGDFMIGETIVGAKSGAHGVVVDQHRFDHCLHGKDGTGSGITGPIVEIDTVGDAGQPYGTGYKYEDFLWFYDPATFVPVAGGKIWDVEPTDWGYALDIAPNYAVLKDNSPAGGGAGNCISADEQSRLILIPTGYSIPGNPNSAYVNVFAVAP